MTDATAPETRRYGSLLAESDTTRRRNAAETRFQAYGMAAIAVGLIFLAVLLVAIVRNGIPAFTQTYMTISVELPADKLDKNGNRDIDDLKKVSTFGYNPLIAAALERTIAERGIQTEITKGKDLAKVRIVVE